MIANENASTASSTHSAPASKTSNGNLESPPTNQEKADDRPKPHFTSIITRPPRDEVEPEIAELEAVLKSLAMATSLTNGNGNGNVHFPDVEDIPIVNGGEKKEHGVTKAEEEKETKKANGAGKYQSFCYVAKAFFGVSTFCFRLSKQWHDQESHDNRRLYPESDPIQ